jgi:hypothetical protein
MKTEQHSKILGFALIAYGLQFFFPAINQLTSINRSFLDIYSEVDFRLFLDASFYQFFSNIFLFLVSLASGILIIIFKNRIKYLAVLFVFLLITVFPLGTILSFYTLWYLFGATYKVEESR